MSDYATSYGTSASPTEGIGGQADTKWKRVESLGLVVSFILMIIMNILSNAVCGVGKDPVCKNNGQQSNDNPTYITPDGFTFAIWGLIYIFELCYTVYQALPVQRGGGFGQKTLDGSRKYVIAAFLLNGLWLILFSFSLWWLSEVVILAYLYCIAKTYDELQVNWCSQVDRNGAKVTVAYKLCCYAPWGLQAGWLVVASSLGLSVLGSNNGWTPPPDFGVMIITVATAVASYLAITRNDLFYAFITCWALQGIIRAQNSAPVDGSKTQLPKSWEIIHWATTGFYVLIVATAIGVVRAVMNRNTPVRMERAHRHEQGDAMERPLV